MRKLILTVLVSLLLISSVSASDLLGYWNFDETSGSTAYDSSGLGNDGALLNMTDANWVSGKFGNGLDFNRTLEQHVNFGEPSSLKPEEYSISLWFKADDLEGQDYSILIDKGLWNNNGYSLYLYNDSSDEREIWFSVYRVDGSPSGSGCHVGSPDEAFKIGNWSHVVGTYNGTNIILYVNGSQVASDTCTYYPMKYNGSENVILAGLEDDVVFFDGIMDELKIYNRSLTDTEVNNLYLYNYLTAPIPQPVTETMEDVGAGVGGLLSGMGTPLTVLIILLGVASAFGFVLATIGKGLMA